MRIHWALITVAILGAGCCNHKKITQSRPTETDSTMVENRPIEGIPGCVQSRIDSIRKLPKWNPPATVDEYSYQGKTVYLFSADCCDQFNMLYDSDCNAICAPSGGITGRGNMKCPEFQNDAKLIRQVWKDPR